MSDRSNETVELFCRRCECVTDHAVLHKVKHVADDDDGYYAEDYGIVRCGGCRTLALWRRVSRDDHVDDSGRLVPEDKVFPPAGSGRITAKYYWGAPEPVQRIYQEAIEAFNNSAPTLCAAGIRAVVEGICADKGVHDGEVTVLVQNGVRGVARKGTLEGKIWGLAQGGHITQAHADLLHKCRFLGNESLHELATPSAKQLCSAFELIEHTIEHMYELREKAGAIHERNA